MDKGLVVRPNSDAEELARKQGELSSLRVELVEQELLYSDYQRALALFTSRYMKTVGILYAELDDWNARIAELQARIDGNEESNTAAERARSQADNMRTTVDAQSLPDATVVSSAELRSLYRKVARLVHPDLDPNDPYRDELMKEAGEAYRKGDFGTLKRILDVSAKSFRGVAGNEITSNLIRVLQQISHLRSKIAEIRQKIADLEKSDTAKLKARMEEAALDGTDLLAEISAEIKDRIEIAKREFTALGGKGATV
jgi:hypothetical protein